MFDIHATLVANFCNYHTILYVFNSLICVEMANLYDLLSKAIAIDKHGCIFEIQPRKCHIIRSCQCNQRL